MLMLAEAGRSLNKNLESLFRHNSETPNVLERLVREIHTDKELCSYMFLNHPGSEDMLWGLLSLLDSEDSRVAGNAAYVIGTLAEMDLGKKRIVHIFVDRGEQTKRVLPSLTKMLDMLDMETVMNAAGTLGTLAENDECRMWMLKEESLDDTIDKLTRLLSCKDMCTASNAALVLARFTIAEEGCARILRHRNSLRTLVQLCKALGTDETGRGMNSAFAIGRLCDLEAGCARILAMPESKRLIVNLINMLGSDDIGCTKNSCFALSCIASFPQGHTRLLAHPEIDNIIRILSGLLSSHDDELVWFSAMMLRTIGSQKNGCLYLRTQEPVKPALQAVLQRPNIKKDTLEEVEDTLAILEKLPKPKPPTLKVESAYSIIVNWEAMHPRSGLDVIYELYQDKELVYEGHKSSYIANNLVPVTSYTFCVRAYTEGDDGHRSSVVSVTTPESVPSAPQCPRVAAKTTNQIKIMWDPPEKPNGVLKAYQVVTREIARQVLDNFGIVDTGNPHHEDWQCTCFKALESTDQPHYSNTGKTTYLDISENYLILSGLPADTEYTFEIYALTSKGRGEAAILTTRTDDLASHAPPKPVLQALGRHEILVQWEHPPRPLGRINSFEVKINDIIIYTGIEKSCIARFLKPNTEYVVTVSAWTSEGRCESLPAKKRTAREIYRKAKDATPNHPVKTNKTTSKRSSNKNKTVPIRKPLYPYDSKTLEKGTEKSDLKRAKTAGVLTIPTAESPTKNETKGKLGRVSSSVDNRLRPNTVSTGLDNNANKTSKKVPGRKSSINKTTLSSSLDSLKDTNRKDTTKDALQDKSLNIDTRRSQFSRRVSKSEKAEQGRPGVPKGLPRRSSLPGIPTSYSRTKPRPNRFSPANGRTDKSPLTISSRGSSDSDDRDRPSPVNLTDALVSMKISKPESRRADEKPASKSNFAVSVKELKHIHRSNQTSKRELSLETAPPLVTMGSAQRLKKKDSYSP